MKKILTAGFPAFIVVIICCNVMRGQEPGQWTYYFGHNYVRTLAAKGDTLWIGYDYGLEARIISNDQYRLFFSYNSGLFADDINKIVIDSDGNKWVSTGSRYTEDEKYSLAKFDNTKWTVYTKTDSGREIFPVFFVVDSLNSVWISQGNSNLLKFDGRHWVDIVGNSWTSDIFAMAIDKSGSIWTSIYKGLVKFSSGKFNLVTIPASAAGDLITCLDSDSHGNLWAGTQKSGLLKYDGNSWTQYSTAGSGIEANGITAVYADKNGNIWTGLSIYYSASDYYMKDRHNSRGLGKFDGKNWTVYNYKNSGMPMDFVTVIAGDDYGNIWTGTRNSGLVKFNDNEWKIYNTSNSSLPVKDITNIIIDPNGNSKWFCSQGGLSELEGNSWKVFNNINSGLPANGTYIVAFDKNGNKWIGTDSGLAKYDNTNWTVYNKSNSGLPENLVSTIAIDHKGIIWTGNGRRSILYNPPSGLVRFDGVKWNTYNMQNSPLPTDFVSLIKIDSQGNKWIVYKDYEETAPNFPLILSGLFKYNDSSWLNFMDYAGLPIYAVDFDKSGKLWAGGRAFGLTVYDGWDWTDYYRKNHTLPCDTVTAIAVDSAGRIWVGTLNGLATTDGRSWKIFNTTNSELRSNLINALAVDDSNYLWIAAKDNWVSSVKLNAELFTGIDHQGSFPVKEYSLSQNYPNPFNPLSKITFAIAENGNIKLALYDILGREIETIANGYKVKGNYSVLLDASKLPSGIYFYRLEAGQYTGTKKCVVVK